MKTLYLPTTFDNKMLYDDIVAGKLVRLERTVSSATGPISVDYSGPLGQSYSAEALKTKRKLELTPGDTKTFSDEEAKFLIERYPFIQEGVSLDPKAKSLGEVDKTPAVEAPKAVETPMVTTSVREEIPTNYMQLKKWAIAKGLTIEKTDRKETILQKIAEANLTQ